MSKDYQNDLIERMAAEARRGKVSRREFMNYAILSGITVSAASSLWSSQVAAATPKRGGTFRIGMHDGNTSDSHDPGTYLSFGSIHLGHTFRSYLTEISPDGSLGPDVADSWSASEDATAWTFELNKNATFHDGRKVTAKDVVASLNHHRGEDSASAGKALLASIEEIKTDGDHTVHVTLEQGFADLPWILTDYHLAVCPAKDDGSLEWETGLGAGPYKIEAHEPGVGTSLVRHDGWHREGAHFDAVQYTILNDPNARQTAIVTGEVDAISAVDLKTLSLMKRNKDIEIDNVPSGSAVCLPMFVDVDPFNDVNVRLALKYAIDREELVDKILQGTGTVANDFHVSPGMPYYPDDLPQRPYDLDKAKFHLKKAGLSSLDIGLSAADSAMSGAVDMCTLFAEQAKGAGINIKVTREPNDGYWSNVWMVKPFTFVKWGARPTPDNMFTLAYKDDAAWNESHWKNPRFNELLLLAKKELNQERRAELYREMCILAKDDGGTIIPMFTNFVYARRKNVRHSGQLAASWELDGARSAHRWWFDDA